jgi:mono/diheme cytochrome c family protein
VTEARKIIMEGRAGTAMTGFGTYNDEQVAARLAYIRSLKP